MRRSNSSRARNRDSTPSVSAGRRPRVVAETARRSCGTRSRAARTMVPLPAPDGPVTTKTFPGARLAVEEANQLVPLTVREAADGLRLADPALVEQARGLDTAELRYRHQHVEDLRGRDELRRLRQNLVDRDVAGLQILLQLSALDADVVRPLQCLHALVQRPNRGLHLGLGRHHERRILPTSQARANCQVLAEFARWTTVSGAASDDDRKGIARLVVACRRGRVSELVANARRRIRVGEEHR